MHFGPSSGEPCPFRLEPINPATLGKMASWVWKHGCQQFRGRLCTSERGPLPCETRETGLKSRRGRQQSTAPRAFPGANGGRDSEQPELSKHHPGRLLSRAGIGRGRERGLLGRGDKFHRDGEEAVPTQWCCGKGLPLMLCLLISLCPTPSPVSTPCSVVSAWNGDWPPLPWLLLFMVPQPRQRPSSELWYQWGLGMWVCKPHLSLLHGGAQGTMVEGLGG